jgi:hypothetical protein
MTMYIGPVRLAGQDGVRRIGDLTVHSTAQQMEGDWSASFRPNGGNPINTGNAGAAGRRPPRARTGGRLAGGAKRRRHRDHVGPR